MDSILIACLQKRLFCSTEVLNLRKKHLISINGKKKLKEYSVVFLVEGEKFRLQNLPSRIPCFCEGVFCPSPWGIRSYSLFLTRVPFQYVVQSLDKTCSSFTL